MLADYSPVPTIAVADLDRARAFYEGVLGFATAEENHGGLLYRSGGGEFMVYPSSYAGTNRATAMAFTVPLEGFDAEIEALRDAGVEFQTFDMPGIEWTGGVATMGPMRSVWFADPDGNILNVSAMG